jgi:hypothetical protein
MSPEGASAAKKRIELRLVDEAKRFENEGATFIGQQNKHGMLNSGSTIIGGHRLIENEFLARAQLAWAIARGVIDNEGWTPSEANKAQLRELIAHTLGPASADLDAFYERICGFLRGMKVPEIGPARTHALDSAMAEAEIDLLGRQARRLPLEDELGAPRYQPAREHWRKAIAYAATDPPDLPNAAKEAVSSVESLALVVAGSQGTTLGDAIKALRSSKRLPTGADKILEGLYAFASDAPGARHGSPLPPHVDPNHWQFLRTSAEGALRLLLDVDAVS